MTAGVIGYRPIGSRGCQGGIVVLRSTCLTNQQTDSVIAVWLDELQARTIYEYQPNLCRAIGEVLIARDTACRKEKAS